MIIIRKLLSLFLVLVVITSLSFSAFAAGEQPSGSNYSYLTSTGGLGTNNYWYAVSQSIYQIGVWLKPLKDSTYRYFDGTSTASTNNFFTALANSLYYIGANVRTNFTSLISDTGTIASRISTTNSTLSTISSEKLPTQSGYSYDNNSGSVSNQTYWSATSNQLTFIFRRLATINSNIEDIESNIHDYSTQLNSINSNTSSINTNTNSIKSYSSTISSNTTSIDGKLPTGNYAYIRDNGEGVPYANSTLGYWRAVTTSLTHSGIDIDDINEKMPNGFYAWMGSAGATAAAQSTRTYWSAISGSLAYMGQDIEQMKNDIIDLHTMFASPEDLALKADQENNISAATTSFLSGNDSSTSVGTGSIGKVKDLGDDAATWFDTGVQATSLFDVLSNDDSDGPWMWFTQATMDDLDSTSNNRSIKSSSSPGEYVPDLYGAKMDELRGMLSSVSEVKSKSDQNYVFTASDFQRQEVQDYVD